MKTYGVWNGESWLHSGDGALIAFYSGAAAMAFATGPFMTAGCQVYEIGEDGRPAGAPLTPDT